MSAPCPWCGYTQGHEPLCLGAHTVAGPFDQDPPHIEPPTTPAETRREAREAILPVAGTLRALVLAAIIAAGARGATTEELEAVTGLPGNTVRPRLDELRKAGLVQASGTTRTTRSGRRAVVWVAATRAAAVGA